MRALQKLVRNGSSTQVTIPRPMLIHLGWLPGAMIVLELLEDKTVRVRPVELGDIAPKHPPRIMLDTTVPASV